MEQKTFYIVVSAGVVLALIIAFIWGKTLIKGISADTAKKFNWFGFVLAIFGGSAWYVVKHPAFMFVTLFGVIIYFLFYDFDKKPGLNPKP